MWSRLISGRIYLRKLRECVHFLEKLVWNKHILVGLLTNSTTACSTPCLSDSVKFVLYLHFHFAGWGPGTPNLLSVLKILYNDFCFEVPTGEHLLEEEPWNLFVNFGYTSTKKFLPLTSFLARNVYPSISLFMGEF